MNKRRVKNNKLYKKAKVRGQKVSGVNKMFKLKQKLKKVGALALIAFVVVFGVKIYMNQRAELKMLVNQKTKLENEITEVKDSTADLHEEVDKLDDPSYIEYVARKEYGMVGKDDIIFVPARTSGE